MFEEDLDAIIAMVAEPEPPRAFVPPRPTQSGVGDRVELVRPGTAVLVDRPVSSQARERYVDTGLALLVRNRVADGGSETLENRPAAEKPALRDPARGLPLALLIGLVAAFIAFVSAEPFWLASGVGSTGTATVIRCGHQCTARFTPDDGSFAATARLVGVEPAKRKPGARVEARMLHPDSEVAYAGSVAGLHLRWLIGLALVLGCGAGVGAVTGVPRLRQEGPQRLAVLWALSFGGPLLLLLVMLLLALI